MAAPKCLAKHSGLLGKREEELYEIIGAATEEELYEIIDAATSVAARRNPKAFASRRDEIVRNLYSLPEPIIGSVYEKSHSNVSAVTQNGFKVATEASIKRIFEGSRVAKSCKFEAAANKKKKVEQNIIMAPKVKSPPESVNSNKDIDRRLDRKFEASKRKFEERSKVLAQATRKTKLIDFSEMKELSKRTRDVKRPRFHH